MQRTDAPQILAALFRNSDDAEGALAELKSTGYTRAEISEVERHSDRDDRADRDAVDDTATRGGAVGSDRAATRMSDAGRPFFSDHQAHASSFVDELEGLGFEKRDAHALVDGVVKGRALVTVDGTLGVANAAAILGRLGGDVHYARGVDGTTDAATDTVGTAAAVRGAAAEESLELREERLRLEKRRVQHGEARLSKRVVTETQSIDVPVTHEELVIERTPARGETPAGRLGESEEIVIPLSEEVVDVQKRTVAREEVVVGKRAVEDVEHVDETLRREELVVDDASGTSANSPTGRDAADRR